MPPAPELTTGDLEPVIISGCVVEPGFVSRDRDQFTLELDPGARVRVNFYLQPGQQPPEVPYGRRIEFSAKTRRPRNYRNPGDFDNVHFLARQFIYWTASILPGETITNSTKGMRTTSP
jgi:competence protein ComEC